MDMHMHEYDNNIINNTDTAAQRLVPRHFG